MNKTKFQLTTSTRPAQKIEQPFLKAVKQTLDERCNETIEEIYKIAIKLIIETIADGYGEDDIPALNEGKEPTSGAGSASGSSNNNNDNQNSARQRTNDKNLKDPATNGGASGKSKGARGGAKVGSLQKQAILFRSENNTVPGSSKQCLELGTNRASGNVEKVSNVSTKKSQCQHWLQEAQAKVGQNHEDNYNVCTAKSLNLPRNSQLSATNLSRLNQANSDDSNNNDCFLAEAVTGLKKKAENERRMEMSLNWRQNLTGSSRNSAREEANLALAEEGETGPAVDERLNETLFVLKELLSLLVAKKNKNKSEVESVKGIEENGAFEAGQIEAEGGGKQVRRKAKLGKCDGNGNVVVGCLKEKEHEGGDKSCPLGAKRSRKKLPQGTSGDNNQLLDPHLERYNKGRNCKYSSRTKETTNNDNKNTNGDKDDEADFSTTISAYSIDHALGACDKAKQSGRFCETNSPDNHRYQYDQRDEKENCHFHLDTNNNKDDDDNNCNEGVEASLIGSNDVLVSNSTWNRLDNTNDNEKAQDGLLDNGLLADGSPLASIPISTSTPASTIQTFRSPANATLTMHCTTGRGGDDDENEDEDEDEKLVLLRNQIACQTESAPPRGFEASHESENVNYTGGSCEKRSRRRRQHNTSHLSEGIKRLSNGDNGNDAKRGQHQMRSCQEDSSSLSSHFLGKPLVKAPEVALTTNSTTTTRNADNELPQSFANSPINSPPHLPVSRLTGTAEPAGSLSSPLNDHLTYPGFNLVQASTAPARSKSTERLPEQSLLLNDQAKTKGASQTHLVMRGDVASHSQELATKLDNEADNGKRKKPSLVLSFWSHIKQSSSLAKLGPSGCDSASKRINVGRRKTNHQTNHIHCQISQELTGKNIEETGIKVKTANSSGESAKLEAQTKSTSAISKNFLLTTDLSDLSELIKMLMLTMASKKHYQNQLIAT